jgi:glutaredoxin-related protein
VDLREDTDILTPMLKRLTSSPDLPVLLIGGTPIYSMDKVRELEKSGELQKMITAAGALINGAKRKKNRK